MVERRCLVRICLAALVLALAMGPGLPPAGAADFDFDGYADLAVGVEWEDVGTVINAGAVNVLYGSSGGISAAGDQIWDQDDLVTADGAEAYDYFGYVLAAGDFDRNVAADLVVGVPGEDIGSAGDGGAVHILYGAARVGLSDLQNQLWHQGSPGVEGAVEDGDMFGAALAVGDFDGDEYDDLAVGVPGEEIDSQLGAGAVNVLYGSPWGLAADGDQIWYEGYSGLSGSPETGDWFGYALAAGNFNGDDYDDLAVSIPDEDLGGVSGAGRVVILYGTAGGLSSTGSQAWVQGLNGVGNNYEAHDHFGQSMVTGDLNGDNYDDLAIGVPEEDWSTISDTGAVNVLYGSSGGLTATGNQVWWDSNYEAYDEFGRALAAGDLNGDGFDELAVGIPYEDLGSLVDTGAVQILYGASGGLYRRAGIWNDFWHQDRTGMEDVAEEGDLFGEALAAGDFDHDQYVDLAVGIYAEHVGTTVDAGAMQVLYGSADGISAVDNRFWHQDSPDIEGGAEANDHFGCSLVAIPFVQHAVYLPLVLRNYQP